MGPLLAAVGLVATERDLEGILALQRASRPATLDGFVTVEHTLGILRAMNALAPSVVARDAKTYRDATDEWALLAWDWT